jgi:hypothetical protein
MELERKYRSYLVRKLSARDDSIGRIIVGDAEMTNWALALLPAGLICWAFSLTGLSSLPVLIPALAIFFAGAGYVLWVRIKYVTEWRKQVPPQSERDEA